MGGVRLERECIQCGETIYSVSTGPTDWYIPSVIRGEPSFICGEDDWGPMPHEPMEAEPIPDLTDTAAVADWLEP